MIIKEAVEELKTHPLAVQEWESDYYKKMSIAFKMAIKSLESLDKIRDEISRVPIERGSGVFDCLSIVNKYVKEVEK